MSAPTAGNIGPQSGLGSGQPPSRYEAQKRRDWNTFGQYLRNMRPPVSLSECTCHHVLEFLRYLDQFGKTKVHLKGCAFFGQPDPPSPCACPLRQAWGSLDALIGRLRAAYEENGGQPEKNPFGNGAIRVYLREVKDCQAKARGIAFKKRKKKSMKSSNSSSGNSSHLMMMMGAGLIKQGGNDHDHNHDNHDHHDHQHINIIQGCSSSSGGGGGGAFFSHN